MIVLRQKTYATAASFKPKFRKRFRNGDFSYVQAKNPAFEGLNHQAYKEVASEDEFKNNPETYKIRQGLFSEVSKEDKKKLEKSRDIAAISTLAAGGINTAEIGVAIGRSIKNKQLEPPPGHLGLIAGATALAGVTNNQLKIKKMYKKYHPEAKKPKWKEMNRWVTEEAGVPQNTLGMIKQKKKEKEGKK